MVYKKIVYFCLLYRAQRSSFCMYIWELSTTHKIPKNCRRNLGWKSIFLFICHESFYKDDPAWPDPPWPDHDALWQLVDILMVLTWNFDTTLIQVLKFSCQNLVSISFITLKQCAFKHRLNFVNFRQFSYHHFRLNGEYSIMVVSSERPLSDVLESVLFYFGIFFLYIKINILVKNQFC